MLDIVKDLLVGSYGPVCFILGYYVCHRGLSGVKNDMLDIKTDVSNIKTKVEGLTTNVATPQTVVL